MTFYHPYIDIMIIKNNLLHGKHTNARTVTDTLRPASGYNKND